MAWTWRNNPNPGPNRPRTIADFRRESARSIEILDVKQLQFKDNDFNCQVEELLNFIRFSREQVLQMSLLYNDLEETLSELWPGCKVHAFGSIVTGLAIKTSDSDCFVQLPEGTPENPKGCVVEARRIFNRYPQKFQKTFVILGARVPIVQFYYNPMSINCDVSFTSITGPTNSNLIGILLSLDKRALQLSIILKYWSKVHYLTGNNFVPNYAFVLMIIMYLQTQNIFPPLKPYINNSFTIGDWDYGYDEAALINYKNENNMSLLELLVGFFAFYNGFDYEKYVISPYVGYPIERRLFLGQQNKTRNVPEAFAQYKAYHLQHGKPSHLTITGHMVVQDIFEHNRNCSIAVRDKQFTKYTTFISNAANLFNKYVSMQNFSPYLHDLLTNVPESYAHTFKIVPHNRFSRSREADRRNHEKKLKKKEKNRVRMENKKKLAKEMKVKR